MADGAAFNGLEWSWIVPLNTALIAITGFSTWLWTRGGQAALLRQQVTSAEIALKEAIERTNVIQGKYDGLLQELHTHMLSDVASFAKLEAIATEASRTSVASEIRLSASLENLGKRIDAMAGRFDQFLQHFSEQRDGNA